MQTILGSGGVIGRELAKALTNYTKDIRLVSRNPQKVNNQDELFVADLLKAEEVSKAVEGSSVVYLTVGIQYSAAIWERDWPIIISNVIEACKQHNCKLVFFDNIYMYDVNYLDGMTEETPINPCSRKGKVRAKISQMILGEIATGSLTALIARSADFYGPGIEQNCMLTESVFKPLSLGKKASWLMSVRYKHSFTYTPDVGEATALLGNTDDAYGQIWHLPTAKNPFIGKQWVEEIAKALNTKPKYMVAPKFVVSIMGLFMPIMKEIKEMLYQYDRDYVFHSDKFESRFEMKPTDYIDGIKEIVEKDYR